MSNVSGPEEMDMDTYTAKPHTVKASRYGQNRWNVEIAPGEHVLLTDKDFRDRYEPVSSTCDGFAAVVAP